MSARHGTPRYRVTLHDTFDSLAAAAPGIAAPAADADLYATWPWFELLERDGLEGEHRRMLVLLERSDDGQAWCIPLLRRQRSAAAVLGGAVTALSNYYSSLYEPIGSPRTIGVDGLRAVLRHLGGRWGGPAVIDLQPLDSGTDFYRDMQAALRAEGYAVDSYFCFGNWHLPVLGRSFADYEPSLPSRLRNTIRRGRKKLDGAGAWSVAIHREPGETLEAAIADFEAIYAQSWKVPEPFPRFVPGLCRMAARHGWLRLGVVRFDDKPIAAQLWITKDGRALIYKLAYDEAYKRFSAGSVLSAELMRYALDVDRVQDVDYLTGDDAYKVDWMSERRERMGLIAFRLRSPAGLLGLAKHHLGRWRRNLRPAARPTTATAGEPTDD